MVTFVIFHVIDGRVIIILLSSLIVPRGDRVESRKRASGVLAQCDSEEDVCIRSELVIKSENGSNNLINCHNRSIVRGDLLK